MSDNMSYDVGYKDGAFSGYELAKNDCKDRHRNFAEILEVFEKEKDVRIAELEAEILRLTTGSANNEIA